MFISVPPSVRRFLPQQVVEISIACDPAQTHVTPTESRPVKASQTKKQRGVPRNLQPPIFQPATLHKYASLPTSICRYHWLGIVRYGGAINRLRHFDTIRCVRVEAP